MIRSNMARTTARPLILALIAGTAAGQPVGEEVVAGQASFSRSGSLTEITAADNTIINYQSFNIGAGETVRFVQPGADARVLNRVLGQDPTRIDGSLISNGRVYIVNEQGVYFGSRAIVDVGAIHAAAGQMTDADFLGGIDRFTKMTGAVENHGEIRAGEVHLAGRRVTNLGAIVAPEGLVTMSVGDRVLVGEHDGHVFVSASSDGANTGEVQQRGTIDAAGGKVMVGAGDMFSIAIGPDSSVRAKAVDVRGGEGSVVTVAGSIDVSDTAPGRMGGQVVITGDGVAVLGADIDASGAAGGGQIHIGGGFQGNDPTIAHASRLNVNRQTTLRADAVENGDGGEIVMWSDDATLFMGRALARGGATGGNGGLVEVSSEGWLGFYGQVNTSAPFGKNGLLLLDPENITIVSGEAGDGADDMLLDDNQLPASDAMGMDVQISDGTIEALDDTDILIAATGNIAIGNLADGSLALTVSEGNTFTFDAGGNFAMIGTIPITTNGGNLVIRAGDALQVPSVDTAGGDLTLEAGDEIRVVRQLANIGDLDIQSTGATRIVTLDDVDAGSISIDTDTLGVTGSIFSRTALDLTNLSTIRATQMSEITTIGAFDGTDAFAILIDPSTSVEGPGGLRFVASTITLPEINFLSALEVTATDELILLGDINLDNDPDALGGRLDLSDCEVVTLADDVRIDTDRLIRDAAGGDVILSGTNIRAMSAGIQELIINTETDTGDASGLIELGDLGVGTPLGRFVVVGSELRLTGSMQFNESPELFRVDNIVVASDDAAIVTNGQNLDLRIVPIDGSGSLRIDLTDGMGNSGAFSYTNVIGANTPLESFTLIGDVFTLPEITTVGDQVYVGDRIFLPDFLTSSGGEISFDGRVTIENDALVASDGGVVRFQNLVGGAGSLTVDTGEGFASFERSLILDALTVNGGVRFDGGAQNIETAGDLVLGEMVGRDRIEMVAGDKSFRSTGGDVIFNGPLNGPADVTIAAGPGTAGSDIPVIRFASNVGAAESLASLTLGDGQSVVPQVASVVMAEFDEDGEPVTDRLYTIRTTGDLTMGQNEKLTALGSLLIESLSGVVTIGDLTSSGAMRVNAPRIDILTRLVGDIFEVDASQDPEVLLDASGRTDRGVDIVSGVSVTIDSPDVRVIGSGPMPEIADPTGNAKVNGVQTRASNTFGIESLYFNRREGTGGGAITDETTVLDARSTGSTTVPLAEGLPNEFRENADTYNTAEAIFEPNPESGELAQGDQGGILLRRTSAQERKWARDGVIWHVDLAESPKPGVGDFRIASARLDPDGVQRFRSAWSELAEAVGVDDTDREEVLARVRSVLGVATDQYKRASGEEFIDPQHFALYSDLRTANADAWRALQLVSAITSGSEALGLTPTEAVRFRKGLIESIRPRGLDSVDLARLIEYAGRSEEAPASIEAPSRQR